MNKVCPTCGAAPLPEARFCRVCGTPLKTGGSLEDTNPVSPLAHTIPIADDVRSTHNFSGGDEQGRLGPETAKVNRAEMEELLQRSHTKPIGEETGAIVIPVNSLYAAPPTSALAPPPTQEEAAVEDEEEETPLVATQAAKTAPARSHQWPVLILASLCALIVAGGLVFFFARRSALSNENANAGTEPGAVNNEKTKPVATESAEEVASQSSTEEAAQQAEEQTSSASPTPAPSATVAKTEQSKDARTELLAQNRASGSPTPVTTPTPAASTGAQTSTQASTVDSTVTSTPAPPDPDKHYSQALAILGGRDPKQLKRAELGQLIILLQRARGGPHDRQARALEDRIGRELDRRRENNLP